MNGKERYRSDQKSFPGSLCMFCFDTTLKDNYRDRDAGYTQCDCSFVVMYSEITRDILLTFFGEPYTDIIMIFMKN